MQTANDERGFDVMNNGWLVVAGTLAVGLLLWAVLFAAYRTDRADAASVASVTVLLVVPPLVSYYLLMELMRSRFAVPVRIGCVYVTALAWLAVQRHFISPAFGFDSSIGESVANFILLPLFGIAVWFGVRSLRYRRRLAVALLLQEQTELRLLDAQLAPHTLFNMLNTVYAVLLTDHEKAIPLFLSMSEALRHLVDHTRKRWIPLHQELAFIDHYATLERARNPDRVSIAIITDGDLDVPVPPMLLAPLFENAVKYGRFPNGMLDIAVTVSSGDDELRFDIRNRYPVATESGTGIGHANVRKRLQLLYPERSDFRVSADDGIYRAAIRISP